jgi:hypothetical protein
MMARTAFEITRADGRSNAQVLLDHVKEGDPGRVYFYEELIDALSRGGPQQSVQSVQRIVRAALKRLLHEQQRTLKCVINTGYQLAFASEHLVLSGDRTKRGMTQWQHARLLLEEVRWGEMDTNARKAHQGMLLIMQGFWGQLEGHEKRIRRIERALADVRGGKSDAIDIKA